MKTPHVHCKFIKAWADGDDIEFEDGRGGWKDAAPRPEWSITTNYRIKPEPLDSVEQEPHCVAVINVLGDNWRLEYLALPSGKHRLYAQQYHYTAPPKREWVGLTDERINEIYQESKGQSLRPQDYKLARHFARAIEAAHGIKEMNHD